MITPLMERALMTGKATAGIFNGAFISNVLDVPKNKYAIIHHISIYPFADIQDAGSQGTFSATSDFLTYSLRIGSDYGNNNLTMRFGVISLEDALGFHITPIGDKQDHDVYIPGTNKIFLEWVRKPLQSEWTLTDAIYPANTYKNIQPPTGYGNTANGGLNILAQVEYNDVGGTQYRMRGRDALKEAPGVLGVRERFEFPVNAASELNPPILDGIGVYTYPMLNVHYLLFDGNPGEFVKQTTG